jgi:hypothetical protein
MAWEALSVRRRPEKTENIGALPRPKTLPEDGWDARITRARNARSAAQALRRGKSATFPTHLTQP